jgi:hypothetical protein
MGTTVVWHDYYPLSVDLLLKQQRDPVSVVDLTRGLSFRSSAFFNAFAREPSKQSPSIYVYKFLATVFSERLNGSIEMFTVQYGITN